jgi:hypothetical protein
MDGDIGDIGNVGILGILRKKSGHHPGTKDSVRSG